MNPEFSLNVIVAIAGFLLKTTVAFWVCVALNRLSQSANYRFVAWSGFVCGSAAYWLYLANGLWATPRGSTGALVGLSQPENPSAGAWLIPASWAFPLGLSLRIVGILYLLTLCYLTFDHFRKRRHLRWVLSFTSEPPVEIVETFESLAKGFHAGRSKLLILSGATSPATFGWIRPTVLLPASCIENDRFELEDIIRHELHHVQRCDAIWNGLGIASRGLLFFHPAIWYAVREMQFERELACDLAVVSQSPASRAEYAECLIRFARLNVIPDSNAWGIDFAASANHLTVRVHSILAGSSRSRGWVRYLRMAAGVTLSGLFLSVVPSLAVLLSFAPESLPTMASPSVTNTPERALRTETKAGSRIRSSAPLTGRAGRSTLGGLDQAEADHTTTDLQPGLRTDIPSAPTSAGPLLRHRRDLSFLGTKGAPSQTIALADSDAKGEPTKAGDRKQAVQQTAEAALGIYKRLSSSVDRH